MIKKALLLSMLFLVFQPAYATDERDIGHISNTKLLVCKFQESNSEILLRNFDKEENFLSESALSKKKVKSILKKQNKTIKNLKTKIRTEDLSKNKKSRLRASIDRAKLVINNTKSCQSGDFKLKGKNDSVPINPEPPLEEDEEFDYNSRVAGDFDGTCGLAGTNVSAYREDLNSPLLAPLSGNLKCTLNKDLAGELEVKIFVDDKSENPELLLSKTIKPEQINNKVFYLSLCEEFPGCFRSKKVLSAIANTGIRVEVNSSD